MHISSVHSGQSQPRSLGSAALGYTDGRLSELYQKGCLKFLLPRFGRDAVLVNTSGGLTGGDRLRVEVNLGAGESLTVTTQAAERICRAASDVAKLDQRLRLEAGARLDWLPQETILFNGAALERRLTVDMAEDARFLGLETYVFGRAAHGEVLDQIHLRDRWRITREGRLIHAEAMRIDGMPSTAATLGGLRAAASLVFVAPLAEDFLDAARAVLPEGIEAGVSTPSPGVLVSRFLAPSSQALRLALIPLLTLLRDGPVPRVWQF